MKIWIIAKIGLKECLRYRVIYFIFLMAVVFIYLAKGCNPGEVKGNEIFFNQQMRQNMAMMFAFHAISFWSVMLCGLISAQTLTHEIEDGTALLTLSRPLHRATFVCGRLLAVLIVSVLNLYVLGVMFCVMYYFETGLGSAPIFFGFTVVVAGLVMYALLNLLLSLLIPRFVAPLLGFFIYLASCFASLPVYSSKIRLVWTPSETISSLYRLLPRFGDLQFIGASCIQSSPALAQVLPPLAWTILYCVLFWWLAIRVFSRKVM